MEVGEAFKNKSNYEIKLKADSESGWKRGGRKETMLKRQILRINITSSKLTVYTSAVKKPQRSQCCSQ